ncbi:MFS transporter [Nocardioides sp.]|uniref:MFS transporter n=1 Tax=Nocardioides sp. TaxID=35761 RepID=UPI0039E2B91C
MTRRSLAPLRDARFRWYFLSRLVNQAGSTMAPIALAFAVLEVSESAGALPPRTPTAGRSSIVQDLAEGWVYFRRTTWLWVVVLSFALLNAIHAGAFYTLGPIVAKQTAIGIHGWGLIMSAEAVGVLVLTVIMLRLPIRRPLLTGMLGAALAGIPLVVMGLHPATAAVMVVAFAAGMGVELFSLGWALAMQENVPDEMLSRANSYDMLGSFVAIPAGQLAVVPLAGVFGEREILVAGGVAYVAIALLALASPAVRDLPRAGAVTTGPR